MPDARSAGAPTVSYCTCEDGRSRHARTCALWTTRTCECDPMGEGLDHHAWCGQHPDNAPARPLSDGGPGGFPSDRMVEAYLAAAGQNHPPVEGA